MCQAQQPNHSFVSACLQASGIGGTKWPRSKESIQSEMRLGMVYFPESAVSKLALAPCCGPRRSSIYVSHINFQARLWPVGPVSTGCGRQHERQTSVAISRMGGTDQDKRDRLPVGLEWMMGYHTTTNTPLIESFEHRSTQQPLPVSWTISFKHASGPGFAHSFMTRVWTNKYC